jgi:hypothetical protein
MRIVPTPSRRPGSRPHTPNRHSGSRSRSREGRRRLRSYTPSRHSRSRHRRPGSRSYSPYRSSRQNSLGIRSRSRSPALRSSPYDPRINGSSWSPQPPRVLLRSRSPGEAKSSGDDALQDSDSHEVEHESSLAPPRQGLAKLQAQPDGLVESSSLEPVDTATTSVSETGTHSAPLPSSCMEH